MKTRAAVAWEAGKPLQIEMIELDGPEEGEVLLRDVCSVALLSAAAKAARSCLAWLISIWKARSKMTISSRTQCLLKTSTRLST